MTQLALTWPDVLPVLAAWKHVILSVALILLYLFAFFAAGHILLGKRDPRAALGWIVVCLGFPGVGVLFYLLFGINRVKTRGSVLASNRRWTEATLALKRHHEDFVIPDELATTPAFHRLRHIVDALLAVPLVGGCHVELLHNGEEAYPAIEAAIRSAQKSVFLVTYIFDSNKAGQKLIDALADAHARGVDVRVLIDGFGSLYSYPSAYARLKKRGVPVQKFLPVSLLSRHGLHLNLRNHRKIVTVDGKIGFTGGMNLGDRHVLSEPTCRKKVADVHFRVTGPVVGQLQDIFLDDWAFATSAEKPDVIEHDRAPAGTAICRGIPDAPDVAFENIRLAMIAAITAAQKSVRVMTPYFIPEAAFSSALISAALKGVRVQIVLPETNNLWYMKYASQAYFAELLQHNVEIYYQPAPFAHSKFLIVDDFYCLVGSANVDPRSLRLNFEFNLEVFDFAFCKTLTAHFDTTLAKSQPVVLAEFQKRPLAAKLRDGFFKLFSPYI